MEPEISHRCTACGASIRAGAAVCPQCGENFSEPVADASSNHPTDNGKPPQLDTKPLSRKPEMTQLPFSASPNSDDQVQSESEDGVKVAPSQIVVVPDTSHSKRQRVKDAALGIVYDNVRPRVEKLRHASSVVLEEAAAIDPSLRFILIAVFLFILFIVMLVLSFVR